MDSMIQIPLTQYNEMTNKLISVIRNEFDEIHVNRRYNPMYFQRLMDKIIEAELLGLPIEFINQLKADL
jgi:hypothetical protein